MEFAFLSRDRRAAAGAIAVFLAGAAFAQAPDQPTMTPDRSAPRQPTPSSVQQAETREAEQKVRCRQEVARDGPQDEPRHAQHLHRC